ncbi:MAG: cytochrome c biogenesis protein CcsA [Bacteroidales bacterium]|nr:cytochrome c biogenesis protein CcsA [Bacteroidales bacterium]
MWIHFEIYAIISFICWTAAIFIGFLKNKFAARTMEFLSIIGILSLLGFIIELWISLERPPLRTLGETRLWYSFFMALIGFVIYKHWKLKLFNVYSLSMSLLFLLLNYLNPDIHNKALMPALQSYWFIPHVIVYMVAYAFIGISFLIGIIGLYQTAKNKPLLNLLEIGINQIYIGFGFLTLGLLFGALWAKEAWGHYWTWDPKETWALLTWGVYLVFIHIKKHKNYSSTFYFTFMMLSFIILLICWFGINYLPSAQNSVHVYSN